jgi:DNA polymerase-3 subunit epsilon
MSGLLWARCRRAWGRRRLADAQWQRLYDAPPPGEWVALDCETTGLDTRRDEILAIGAVRIVGQRVLTSEALSLRVRPQGAVPASSVRIHRLRTQDVAQGLLPEDAVRQLLHFIGSRPLVGYHLAFDVAMLDRVVLPMLGVRLPQPRIEVAALYHDWVQQRRRGLAREQPVDLRFEALLAGLDLPLWPAHDALHDAVMAALAFIKLRHLA